MKPAEVFLLGMIAGIVLSIGVVLAVPFVAYLIYGQKGPGA